MMLLLHSTHAHHCMSVSLICGPYARVGWGPRQSGTSVSGGIGGSNGSGGSGSARAAFVVLVAPGGWGQRGLGLMLKSLHAHVLTAHPRPVLLFYGDDVPPGEYAPEVLDALCPPAIRHLIEVRAPATPSEAHALMHCPVICAVCHGLVTLRWRAHQHARAARPASACFPHAVFSPPRI